MGAYRLRPKAVQDLEEIGDYIAADNPARAVAFIGELRVLFTRMAERPKAYGRRDDLAPGLRQAVHGRYLVLFTAAKDGIVVERILHGARRLEDLL